VEKVTEEVKHTSEAGNLQETRVELAQWMRGCAIAGLKIFWCCRRWHRGRGAVRTGRHRRGGMYEVAIAFVGLDG